MSPNFSVVSMFLFCFRSMEPTVGRWGCEWPSWLAQRNGWYSNRTLLGLTENAFDEASGVLSGNTAGDHNKSLAKLIECRQIHGIWPLGHPLPLPRWEDEPIKPYQLESIREYETLACEIEMHLQKLLEEHNYDTTGNFIDFYENFQKSRCNSVLEFFHL